MDRISPHYRAKKLEPPFFKDLVDVFEDRMRYWMLEPAKHLLQDNFRQIAAVGILIHYFEGIEIYLSGKDSDGKSYKFFRRGFEKVFDLAEYSEEAIKQTTKGLYKQARCGFSHDGMFRNRVLFSDLNENAMLVTWPKKNGKFVFANGVESIVINPSRFYEAIEIHFEKYLKSLKSMKEDKIVIAFKNAVDLKWGLENEHISIGTTKEEFINNPKYLGQK